MNKRTLLATAWVLLMGTAAHAGVHNMAGCGLGSMLFKDNEKGPQILAATTNGTFGNQTFGITSGTLGCTKDGKVALNQERIIFAESNFISLKREMAVGQGQYLNSFASLYGYKTSAQQAAFGKLVQQRYEALLPSAKTTAAEMLANLDTELAKS